VAHIYSKAGADAAIAAAVAAIPAPPDLSGYVPTSRKVNGQALTGDITLDAADVGALPDTYTPDLSGYTPTSDLADVATSGSYADLSDKPTIPDSADDISAAPASGQFATHTLTAAASVTLSASYPAQALVMNQATTLVAPIVSDGHAIILWLSGAFVPTWWAGIKWAGGTPPTYTSTGTLYHLVKMIDVWFGSGQAYS
jgi:hypothetical protein